MGNGEGKVFDSDQKAMLELMFDNQANKIAKVLAVELDTQIKNCKDTRPCNEVKISTLATKEEIKPENLLDYKKAPVFWLKIVVLSFAVNSVANAPSVFGGAIELVQRLFGFKLV